MKEVYPGCRAESVVGALPALRRFGTSVGVGDHSAPRQESAHWKGVSLVATTQSARGGRRSSRKNGTSVGGKPFLVLTQGCSPFDARRTVFASLGQSTPQMKPVTLRRGPRPRPPTRNPTRSPGRREEGCARLLGSVALDIYLRYNNNTQVTAPARYPLAIRAPNTQINKTWVGWAGCGDDDTVGAANKTMQRARRALLSEQYLYFQK